MSALIFRKNLLEVPKLDFEINFDFKINEVKNNIEYRFKALSDSLPSLPQVNLRVPEVSLSLESLRKLEVYEYFLKTLHNFLFVINLYFNLASWFSLNSANLTTQINSTISNFYCFMNQIMEIINFSNKKTWDELKSTVNEIRKKFSNISCTTPTNIQFRELADGRTRIYFLCAQSKYDTLLYVDINNPNSQTESPL
jgi:hypothetical protein